MFLKLLMAASFVDTLPIATVETLILILKAIRPVLMHYGCVIYRCIIHCHYGNLIVNTPINKTLSIAIIETLLSILQSIRYYNIPSSITIAVYGGAKHNS